MQRLRKTACGLPLLCFALLVSACASDGRHPLHSAGAPAVQTSGSQHSAADVLVPFISSVLPDRQSSHGKMHGTPQLSASVGGAVNVVRVEYQLDLAPFGAPGPEDLLADSTLAPDFAVQFEIGALRNQTVQLRADYFSSSDLSGWQIVDSLWLFNQPGDCNGDGVVGAEDLEIVRQRMGQQSSQLNFESWVDGDLDGRVTEADAALVGYNFGVGAVLPQIGPISPLLAASDSTHTFSAVVSGTEPLNYEWDFGGAGLPGTSIAAAPEVTFPTPGTYSASLKLSNQFGSATQEFTLEVIQRQPPQISLETYPRIGNAPLLVDFDASLSSSPGAFIERYQWSWDGDTTWEVDGSSPLVQHEFTSAGQYDVRLQVTDDAGLSTSVISRVWAVDADTPQWQEITLGDFGTSDSNSDLRLSAAEVDGKPAVIWVRDLPSSEVEEVYVAVAQQDEPLSAADFRIDMVHSGDAEGSPGICGIDSEAAFAFDAGTALMYGRYHGDAYSVYPLEDGQSSALGNLCMASVDGRPALMYNDFLQGSPQNLCLTYAFPDTPDPQSFSDWTHYYLSGLPQPAIPANIGFQLKEIGGVPFFQARGIESGDYLLLFASSASPTAGDWASFTFEGEHPGMELSAHLFEDAGLPALLHVHRNTEGLTTLNYSLAQTLMPVQETDWSSYNPPPALNFLLRDGASLDGYPAFQIFQGNVMLSQRQSPEADDWFELEIPSWMPVGRKVLSHGGFPAQVVRQGNIIYRYPVW